MILKTFKYSLCYDEVNANQCVTETHLFTSSVPTTNKIDHRFDCNEKMLVLSVVSFTLLAKF